MNLLKKALAKLFGPTPQRSEPGFRLRLLFHPIHNRAWYVLVLFRGGKPKWQWQIPLTEHTSRQAWYRPSAN